MIMLISWMYCNLWVLMSLLLLDLRIPSDKKKTKGTFLEMYGQGRMVIAAHRRRRALNLEGLGAFDLGTLKPDGTPWDFRLKADRDAARQYVLDKKPLFIIGSPPCTACCRWNEYINFRYMPADKLLAMQKEGREHLRFMIDLYKIQIENNRFFLHEHPSSASSWDDPRMVSLLEMDGVSQVISDQCEYGLLTPDASGKPTPARKPTQWASNSPWMLKRLSTRCSGKHKHQALEGGRAKKAELYPLKLILTMIRGIRDTIDGRENNYDPDEIAMNMSSVLNSGFNSSEGIVYKNKKFHRVHRALDSPACTFAVREAESSEKNSSLRRTGGSIQPVVFGNHFKEGYKDEYTG